MVVCLQETTDGDISVSNDQSLCELSEKPAIQQPCATHQCEAIWHFTEWTKVSLECLWSLLLLIINFPLLKIETVYKNKQYKANSMTNDITKLSLSYQQI